MGGSHSDDGAGVMVSQLMMFLQGVSYGSLRDTDNLGAEYGTIYKLATRANDPRYQEYLRLKEIYGDD